MINNQITPGPPEEQASPMEEKMPAPIIAAIPKSVKSLVPNTLFNAPSWEWVLKITFRLNKFLTKLIFQRDITSNYRKNTFLWEKT